MKILLKVWNNVYFNEVLYDSMEVDEEKLIVLNFGYWMLDSGWGIMVYVVMINVVKVLLFVEVEFNFIIIYGIYE